MAFSTDNQRTMRVLLYEWCCSGGLLGPDRDAILDPSSDPAADHSIAREGEAMVLAILADAARSTSLRIETLVDATRPLDLPPGSLAFPVGPGQEIEALRDRATRCDLTLVIAPETGGILARRVASVRDHGDVAIAPDARFILTASDKHATVLALAAAGLPVPAGRSLPPHAPWPTGFLRPAVRKPLDGVGGDGLTFVGPGDPEPAPGSRPARLETAVSGTPVGVACLCGPGACIPLAPLEQRFSTGPVPAYLGGVPLPDPGLRHRARTLACRAIAALERGTAAAARGWVGVDLVLGERRDGREDRILEINPRMTTSFVGHSRGRDHSLIERVFAVACGRGGTAAPPPHEPESFEIRLHDSRTDR